MLAVVSHFITRSNKLRLGEGLLPTASITLKEHMPEYAEFVQKYPAYDQTHDLDELRQRDYGRLDRLGQVYLDYTGGGLYAESQVRHHQELLADNVFGNPHSLQPHLAGRHPPGRSAPARPCWSSSTPTPDEYVVIFTQNASGALKLVGESYPFRTGLPLPADLRQPQLGQRHPRVRPRQGRRGDLHPGGAAGYARG